MKVIGENVLVDFRYRLIQWFIAEQRDLPWRATKEPYLIWLSEVILQQTRVSQGLPYYQAFVKRFPTVQDLASAPEDEVLRLWQGLGYYSRARNLHTTAKEVVQRFDGVFPSNYHHLISLKGIGPYTAAAIASFAADESVAVVDGNVYRVLARYFRIEADINSGTGKKQFQSLADTLVPEKGAGDFNQAVMELGALVCKPGQPDCLLCPIQQGCQSFGKLDVTSYPVKIKKLKIRQRYFHFLVIESIDSDQWLLGQRDTTDIWGGLYQFPLLEMADESGPPQEVIGSDAVLSFKTIHKLTHQELHIQFWKTKSQLPLWHDQGYAFYTLRQIYDLPKPIVIEKFIASHLG